MRAINFTYRDLKIIAMSLIDNCACGHLNKLQFNLAWDIVERLYEPLKLSKADLTLICNSLYRYAIRYDYELIKASECRRVYDMILRGSSHE